MNLRPYISLDIETTGLDPEKDQTLEVAAVHVNCKGDMVSEQSWVIQHDRIEGDLFAINMNMRLIQVILKGEGTEQEDFALQFGNMLSTVSKEALKWDEDNNIKKPSPRIQLAGKNVGSFDRVFIDKLIGKLEGGLNEINVDFIKTMLQHRCVDAGSIYYPVFGYVPSLDEINELTGYKPVTHIALEDAVNVVHGINYYMENFYASR